MPTLVSIAAFCGTALAVSLIVSIVIGGAASLMSDAPGHEHPITALGHRAIGWACAVGVLTVSTVIALEHLQ